MRPDCLSQRTLTSSLPWKALSLTVFLFSFLSAKSFGHEADSVSKQLGLIIRVEKLMPRQQQSFEQSKCSTLMAHLTTSLSSDPGSLPCVVALENVVEREASSDQL